MHPGCSSIPRSRTASRLCVARSILSALLAAIGCMPDPIEWQEAAIWTVERGGPDHVVISPAGGAELAPAPDRPAFAPAGACPGSPRFAWYAEADGVRREVHAVWWAHRADGSASLLAARSEDGGSTWRAPVPVDSLDRPGLGCRRPAPSIAVDPLTGYIHIAYFLLAPEGPGVFFAHSMEGGELYHEPVAVVYGSRPSEAAIAAEGSLVVVAYEDPNARHPRIALALSRTDGHIFEHRLSPISASSAIATSPRIAVRQGTIAVAWEEQIGRSGVSQTAPATVVRIGRIGEQS